MGKFFWHKDKVVQEFAKDKPSIPLARFLNSLSGHKSKTILDAGCGGGRNTELIFRKGFDFYACDSSSAMVKQTKYRMNQISPESRLNGKITKAPFIKFPYKNQFFDVVVSNGVFHNATSVSMLDAGIKEAYRVLKKKGKIYVNMFYENRNTTNVKKTKIPQLFMTNSGLKMTLLTSRDILNLFENAGFKLCSRVKVYRKELNVGVRGVFRAIFTKN